MHNKLQKTTNNRLGAIVIDCAQNEKRKNQHTKNTIYTTDYKKNKTKYIYCSLDT